MIEQFIETLQKYPENSNKILGLEFTARFSCDEKNRLMDTLSDTDPRNMSVHQFYESFGINPEESNIVKRMRQVDKNNIFEWLFMLESLPLGGAASIDDFLAYEIPQEILNITQERIQGLKRNLLDEYTHLYDNPEIPNTVRRLARKARNELYDFGVFMFSFGTKEVLRESEEEVYRRAITKQYQANRKKIEENTSQIVETMLTTFFKLENDPDTMLKIDKKFMSKVSRKRYAPIDKYVIPLLDDNIKELNC